MDWGQLFFKFNGRINRGKYWLAVLIYSRDQYRRWPFSVT